MISYVWSEHLGDGARAEALALVREAARYDEEAGFSVVEPWDVEAVTREGEEQVWHLPVKARRDLSIREDAPVLMVAYLHLSVDPHGQGTVKLVVHPDYRSRGIATLLVEELGLDISPPGGWCGTGATSLRSWAYGSHPASERLTRRFGIKPVARLWTLLRHLSGPFAMPLEPIRLPGGVIVEGPSGLTESATTARVSDVLERAGLTRAQFDQFGSEFAARSGQVLIASVASGRPVGFVWFDPHLREHLDLRAARVHALILVSDIRGGGLGAALLTRALQELVAAGTQLAQIRVDPAHEGALRMLRLLSFEQEDAHACYQIGEWIDPPAFPGR
ncbi:GNAT family N-acetyltransferase [Nocardia sp. NPDC052112]|uniref:GNAT family N-acetyltransferase n=1 Tax=Nocardia sp. NPDC052112 TaxID=3155646 RepID=UPI003418B4C8